MDAWIHLFGLFCALGSAVLATAAAARWHAVASAIAGFAAVAAWTGLDRIPDPASVGLLLVGVALLQIMRPGFFVVAAIASGALAASWVPVLRVQSLDFVPALALSLAVPGVSMLLTLRRRMFAPVSLYEDALLFVVVLGLAVAAMPLAADGWRAAGVLNLDYEARAPVWDPWLLAVGLGAPVLGGCWSLWWRRR